MRIANDDIFDSAQNMSSNFTSRGISVAHAEHFSMQLTWTGTPNGTFTLEVSNDPGDDTSGQGNDDTKVTNWTEVTSSSVSTVGINSHIYLFENAGFRWVRLVFTNTSGSGSLTVSKFNSKGAV